MGNKCDSDEPGPVHNSHSVGSTPLPLHQDGLRPRQLQGASDKASGRGLAPATSICVVDPTWPQIL